jgi:hypothetical protein
MAPIKFEEQLKEKLEKRTIQPSPEAWNALANRLDNQNEKGNNRSFWWLGIAASIVGIILVTTFVFDNPETKISEPINVDINNNEKPKTNAVVSEDVEIQNKESDNDSKSEIKLTNKQEVVSQKAKSLELISPKKEMNIKEAVVSNDIKVEEQAQIATETLLSTSDFEQAKLNDVVAEINRLNAENHGVSEAEIDSLLKQAEREIFTNRIYNENNKTVDASALLQDIEADLEQSFRSRVFEALKSGYVTVKTAVAERNN